MDATKHKKLKRDAFYFFYDEKYIGRSYKELYDYLVDEKKYPLDNEGNEQFRFNRFVHGAFREITGVDLKLPYVFTQAIKNGSDLTTLSKLIMEVEYPIQQVPFVNERTTKKSEIDIYVISLAYFHKEWEDGVTFIEYAHHIKNEKMLYFHDGILAQIYREIIGIDANKSLKPDEKNWATIESIFRLLEYEELQHSLKESKDARKEAKWAIGISIVTFLVSIGFSWYQISNDPKIDKSQFDDIKKMAQTQQDQNEDMKKIMKTQQDQNEKIILLMEKENQKLSDTLKVKIQGER